MRALFSRDSNLKVPGFAQSRVSPEVSLQLFTFKLWKRNVLALWIDNNDPNLLLTRIRGIQNYRYLTCASAWALTYIFWLQRNPWDYRYIMYIGSLFIFWALFPLHLVYLYFSVFFKKNVLGICCLSLQMPPPVTLLPLNFNNPHWSCLILFLHLLQLHLKGRLRRNPYYWIRWNLKTNLSLYLLRATLVYIVSCLILMYKQHHLWFCRFET